MKKLQFTKSTTHHLLSHIYEHLFFIHLDTVLRNEGLFDIIDFTLSATTYKGKITFSIEIDDEYDIVHLIEKATQDFLSIPELLAIAVSQIECEYKKTLKIDDALLRAQLIELNAAPWNTPDEYQPSISCCSVSSTPKDPVALALSVRYEKSDPNSWLLYRQIAGVIMNNLLNDIVDTHGGFVESAPYRLDAQSNISGLLRLPSGVTPQEVLVLYDELLDEMLYRKAYDRLARLLHHSSRLDPNPTDGAGNVISEQLWQEIATPQTIKFILQNISLQITT